MKFNVIEDCNSWRPCESPIGVRRVLENAMIVDFRIDCFDTAEVRFAIEKLIRNQDYWEAYKLNEDEKFYIRMHASYLIWIWKEACPITDLSEALDQILWLMTKAVYQEEVRVHGMSSFDVAELRRPYSVDTLDKSAVINLSTVRALEGHGIRNLYDLSSMTREELCRVKGVSTEGISKIEKALASRGLYLMASKVPELLEAPA